MYALRQDCWPFDADLRSWEEERPGSARVWLKKKTKRRGWIDDTVVATSSSVRGIEAEIQASRVMLDLADDWDEQGAKAVTPETHDNAAKFLRDLARSLSVAAVDLPAPRMSACPDGSIDLFWNRDAFRLLINIEPTGGIADFYGENPRGVQVKGPIRPEAGEISLFVKWLITSA